MNTTPTFHAGICMAGAVSAGAYTAGVMDYLLEALEHWEKAKQLQKAGKLTGIPRHNFVIDVLGGASAGGMTAAISARGVQEVFEPVTQKNVHQEVVTQHNPFYNAWVNLKETAANDMMALMLNTADIDKNDENTAKEVRAGLNSAFINEVATNLLEKPLTLPYDRAYVADDLDIFTTLTNLRGFSYQVKFITGNGIRTHRMRMHRDYAFFTLGEDKQDGRIPLNFTNNKESVATLKNAAMGTGAFPVGLESRTLSRKSAHIMNSKYLNLMKSKKNVHYSLVPDGEFESLNVDGGVINNEPYEITESLLEDRLGVEELKRGASEFNSVVLMIDPFPNDDEADTTYKVRKAWKHVLPSILSAMRNQLMLKDAEIERAYMDNDYTRFLIMPERYDKNNERQPYTIACGALGGFSGFLSKNFREHDYFLGRRNCQRFLQKYFAVPEGTDHSAPDVATTDGAVAKDDNTTSAKNPILHFGYEGITAEDGIGKIKNDKGEPFLCLVPDIRVKGNDTVGYTVSAPPAEEIYPYPTLKLSYITGLKDKIAKRVASVVDNVTNEQIDKQEPVAAIANDDAAILLQKLRKKSWLGTQTGRFIKKPLTNIYLNIGKKGIKNIAADMAIESIVADLATRKLIKDDVYGTGIGTK